MVWVSLVNYIKFEMQNVEARCSRHVKSGGKKGRLDTVWYNINLGRLGFSDLDWCLHSGCLAPASLSKT